MSCVSEPGATFASYISNAPLKLILVFYRELKIIYCKSSENLRVSNLPRNLLNSFFKCFKNCYTPSLISLKKLNLCCQSQRFWVESGLRVEQGLMKCSESEKVGMAYKIIENFLNLITFGITGKNTKACEKVQMKGRLFRIKN